MIAVGAKLTFNELTMPVKYHFELYAAEGFKVVHRTGRAQKVRTRETPSPGKTR
jgi:hypothetical protein